MHIRHIALAAALISGLWTSSTAQAQGFVFGTAEPKAPAAAPAGARNAKVESAQRLLARIGLLRDRQVDAAIDGDGRLGEGAAAERGGQGQGEGSQGTSGHG